MIVSRTPLRISFAGGGTDLREFYSKEYGCVLSTSINKFVYVALNKKFDGRIQLNWSKIEHVDSVDEIQHPIFREAMRLTGVDSGIELTCMADVPSSGSGLGSSSSFTVGVLNALHAFKGERAGAEQLAREACEIEIARLGEPIGKQDQYIAAYGGVCFFKFNPDESVEVKRLECSQPFLDSLQKSLSLFYTNIARSSSSVLSDQQKNTSQRLSELRLLKGFAEKLKRDFENSDSGALGEVLRSSWEEKKKLSSSISNPAIEKMYATAVAAGAQGGKILGAGGGGFLMVYSAEEKRKAVENALSGFKKLDFKLEKTGSTVKAF